LSRQSKLELFEEIVMPHLNAAHNLARWMTRNSQDAQDVVQEAYLRAFRFFDGYQGGDARAWVLEVVRNTCRTWMSRRNRTPAVPFDETTHSANAQAAIVETNQEERMAGREKMSIVRGCLEALPPEFREVLVMRELEEMSYREIAAATGLAIGTVMSRLSRARKRLEDCATKRSAEVVR
jgi:RNA polymerase sigma factor (sigma-70 family)